MIKLRDERAAISALRAVKVTHRSMIASLFTTGSLLVIFVGFVLDFAIHLTAIVADPVSSELLTEIVL